MAKKRRTSWRTPRKNAAGKTLYRNARGHFVSKAEWKSLRALEKLHKAEKQPTPSRKRRKVDTDKLWDARREWHKRAFDKTGKIPHPDSSEDKESYKAKGQLFFQTVTTYAWLFDNIDDARELILRLANHYGDDVRCMLRIGAGKGANKQWVGTTYDLPAHVRRYSFNWNHKTSSQPVLEAAETNKMWFEVTVLLRQDIDRSLFA